MPWGSHVWVERGKERKEFRDRRLTTPCFFFLGRSARKGLPLRRQIDREYLPIQDLDSAVKRHGGRPPKRNGNRQAPPPQANLPAFSYCPPIARHPCPRQHGSHPVCVWHLSGPSHQIALLPRGSGNVVSRARNLPCSQVVLMSHVLSRELEKKENSVAAVTPGCKREETQVCKELASIFPMRNYMQGRVRPVTSGLHD